MNAASMIPTPNATTSDYDRKVIATMHEVMRMFPAIKTRFDLCCKMPISYTAAAKRLLSVNR